MQLQDQLRIVGDNDNSTVAVNRDGKIYVGGITLTRQEATQYPSVLEEAIKRSLELPLAGKPE